MELITGRRALDDTMPDERSHLVSWFRRVQVNKENIPKAIDQTLNTDNKPRLQRANINCKTQLRLKQHQHVQNASCEIPKCNKLHNPTATVRRKIQTATNSEPVSNVAYSTHIPNVNASISR